MVAAPVVATMPRMAKLATPPTWLVTVSDGTMRCRSVATLIPAGQRALGDGGDRQGHAVARCRLGGWR